MVGNLRARPCQHPGAAKRCVAASGQGAGAATPADRSAKTEPVDPEAYDLYLQGHAQLNSGPLALDRAQQLFEQALRKNPKDARPYAGIARYGGGEVWCRWCWARRPPHDSKAAALKAVELDDRLAESHVALAGAYDAELDWARAEAEYKRALELNPNHANAHSSYSLLLAYAQRFQDSATQMDWAIALDPLNGLIRLGRGLTLLAAGRSDDAIRELRFGTGVGARCLSVSLDALAGAPRQGERTRSARELIALITAAGQRDDAQALQQGGGYREAVRRVAALRESQAKTRRPLDPTYLALLHHDSGNRERAFDWMEQAVEDGDPNLPALGILAPDLKGDPRFRSLMQRIGLPYRLKVPR